MTIKWYEKLTLWDRISFDDPLDPPAREEKPYVVSNLDANGNLNFTFRPGAVTSANSVFSYNYRQGRGQGKSFIGIDFSAAEIRIAAQYPGMFPEINRLLNPPKKAAKPKPLDTGRPVPRNRRESRILLRLGTRVEALMPKLEKDIGARCEASSLETWDAHFWEHVSRPKLKKPAREYHKS
jgi:hypothetical protein